MANVSDSERALRDRRLELFDCATERQRRRQAAKRGTAMSSERGWLREYLYGRDRAD